MVKVALLIGVSEYEPGLNPLPAATKDVVAMRKVLENPDIGGFDEVTVLENPQQHQMAVAIETLFSGRQRDDLVLLFFSGHGIKDENGKLYFAARNTCKTDQGALIKATTVAASFVHEVMSNSRSKREVVILDCCFSGAFAAGMLAKDNGFVDIRNQLGQEGRAILTSSTSTQFAFEQQGSDISTYTRYIVEGLKTGAADRDQDGSISVDELHEYAANKVQEAAPAMNPELYAIREGYKIKLAKAPVDDPKLRYRREVEYWVENGNGEISFTGRAALEGLLEELELSSEKAAAIESEVLAPIEVYKKKLQRYELAFRNEIKLGFPPSDKSRADLKRLQQRLKLRDEDLALIEAPIIAEQTTTPIVVIPSPPQNSNVKYYMGGCIIGVIGLLLGGTFVYIRLHGNISQIIGNSTCAKEQYVLNDKISLGEEILLKQDTNSEKEAGVKAFLDGKCADAMNKFNSYRVKNPTDPEALIYLNNAKARQHDSQLKIAVSVPIGTNPNLAKEILRGVAQAHNEVNDSGGINGKLLEVAIANDDENSDTATKIAQAFVQDQKILGVIGHGSSRVTKKAGEVYNSQKLVAISPTSTAVELSNFSPYVFRTVPSDKAAAEALAKYMVTKLQKRKAAVFFTADDPYSESLKNEFVKAVKNLGGQVTEFNLLEKNFNAATAVKDAISQGVEVLMLIPTVSTMNKAQKLIQENQQLEIIGGDEVYSQNNLDAWGRQSQGMVLAIPWHISNNSNSNFVQNSKTLWNATVNWRTATSYDATKAIIEGLKTENTREKLQQKLHSPIFSFEGATGNIQFSQSGDRINNNIILVKVQQKPGTDKYEFIALP